MVVTRPSSRFTASASQRVELAVGYQSPAHHAALASRTSSASGSPVSRVIGHLAVAGRLGLVVLLAKRSSSRFNDSSTILPRSAVSGAARRHGVASPHLFIMYFTLSSCGGSSPADSEAASPGGSLSSRL